MTIYSWLILALWLVFIAVWAVSAARAKRTIKSGWKWRRDIALRLGILVVVLITLRFFRLGHAAWFMRLHAINKSPVAGLAGVVLCALGVGLAVLARVYLGRNWGLPMSLKENPEFITAGPYAAIRHPIYAGILLAIVGSAIGVNILWILVLVPLGPYFLYSARREEEIMVAQFPGQYPEYMKRTKMLVPFVL